MKVWRWLFAAIGWLAVLAAGAGALCLAASRDSSRDMAKLWLEMYAGLPWYSHWAAGLGLVALALAAALSPLGHGREQRLLEFPTDNGTVQVDISALESCLAHMASEEEGVVRARVRLTGGGSADKGPLGCSATIWLRAGPDVLGRVSELQARMRAYYYQVLPVREPVRIDIRTKLVYQKGGARPVEAAHRDAEHPGEAPRPGQADGYQGPQYPTADEAESGDGDVKV